MNRLTIINTGWVKLKNRPENTVIPRSGMVVNAADWTCMGYGWAQDEKGNLWGIARFFEGSKDHLRWVPHKYAGAYLPVTYLPEILKEAEQACEES